MTYKVKKYADIHWLIDKIKTTQHYGRHDGAGNPIISIDLYQKWAYELADQLEELLDKVDNNE